MNRNEKHTPKRGFTTRETSIYIGLSESLLRQGRMDGVRDNRIETPPFVRLGGRKIIYLKEDLDRWLDKMKAASTTSLGEVA